MSQSERRNAHFKHGGHRRDRIAREGMSDAEMDAMTGGSGDTLTDEEFDALDAQYGPPDDRSEDEKNAGAAINVFDTITPSWGDEIVAGAMTPLAYLGLRGDSKGYDDEVARARKIQKRYSEHEPWNSTRNVASTAAGILGGVAPAGKVFGWGVGGVQRLMGGPGKSLLGRAAQAAGGLGLTGAAYSELAQTGEPEDFQGRIDALKEGGAMVPLMGAALGITAGGLGTVGVKGAQRLWQGFRGAEDKAARYLAEKLLGANQTVDDLAAAHAKAAQTGKPVALADVGPQGIKDAAGAAGRTPGPGRETAQQTILPRQEGQVQRVSDDVAGAVGGKPGSFTQTVEEISAQRAKEAAPLYQKAMHAKPLVSPKIVEVTGRPSGKAAMDRGLKIARDEGIPESELVVRDAAGNITGYTTKALHYMKMGLDDMIESAQRSGDNAAGRALTILKNELLGEVDRLNPAYAQARKVFAGHAANQRALESGRKAINYHPDQIRSEMAGMSQSEQEMYRRGFAQRIIEDVEKSPDAGNAARRIFGNTAKRERMRAVLGDEQYNQLAERLGVEDAMYRTYQRTNVGSETAERMAAQGDIDAFLVEQTPQLSTGFAQSLMTGTIRPLVQSIGMGGIANMLRGLSTRARGHIAKMLFSSNPDEVQAALKMIAKEYANAKRFQQGQNAAISQMAAQEKARAAGGDAAQAAYETVPKPF